MADRQSTVVKRLEHIVDQQMPPTEKRMTPGDVVSVDDDRIRIQGG
jgi:hypothetical protein